MDLLVAVDGDYCVTKIQITASIANIKLNIIKNKTHEELSILDPCAKSIVLQTKEGIITQHNAILRYIAEISPAVQLMGITSFDSSQVDQWLDFSWCELGR